MGIRFWCPNGHKLNVKTFQAGRRGICPYCGAKFQIPAESTRKPGAKDLVSEPQEHSVHEGGGGTPPGAATLAHPTGRGADLTAAGIAAEGTYAGPFGPIQGGLGEQPAGQAPAAAAGQTPAAPTGQPQGSPVVPLEPQGGFMAGGTAAGPAPQASAPAPGGPQAPYQAAPLSPAPGRAPADPLAEAPNVVWYVRPPTGGQFGPATSDVMRNWIDEGRVSPDSLVWREGWRDWQEASEVFGQAGADEPEVLAGGIITQPAAGESGGRPAPRHASRTTNAIIITVLVLAVIILFGVFLYVAFGQRPNKTERRTPRGATTMPLADQEATGSPGRAAANHARRLRP